MSRPLVLAALALVPATCSVSAAATGGWPQGEVVFRPECFGAGNAEAYGGSPQVAPPVQAVPEANTGSTTVELTQSAEIVSRRPVLRLPRISIGAKKSAPQSAAAPEEPPPPPVAPPPEVVLEESPPQPEPEPELYEEEEEA